MTEALRKLKDELRKRYLGKHGIHAVGVRESENVICVYLDSDADVEGSGALAAIKKAASPYPVVLVWEGKPRAK